MESDKPLKPLILSRQWDEVTGDYKVRTSTNPDAMDVTGETRLEFIEKALAFAQNHDYDGIRFREAEYPGMDIAA